MLAPLLAALILAVAPGGLLKDPEADRLLGEAQAAFEQEDFAKAAKLLEEAYLIEPNAQLLYPWAQAERSLGHCETAIQLYERFLESDPGKQFADAARGNIERCREQIEEEGDAPMIVDDSEDAAANEEPEDVVEDVLEEPEPEPVPIETDPGKDDPPKARAWYKDPAGGVLVGLGVAGVGAGGALLGIASSRANAAEDADLNSEYVDMRDGAKKLNAGGIAALSIGGALLVSGVIRWAVVAKKNKAETAALRLAPGVVRGEAGTTVGLSWSGRF